MNDIIKLAKIIRAVLNEQQLRTLKKYTKYMKDNYGTIPFDSNGRYIFSAGSYKVQDIQPNEHIKEFIQQHNYAIDNYVCGQLKDINNPNKSAPSIVKLLNKYNREDLIKTYQRDIRNINKKSHNQQFDICITKKPQDVAGMSTGKNWTSCMNLEDGGYKKEAYNQVKYGGMVAYLINHNYYQYKNNQEYVDYADARIGIKRFVSTNGLSFMFLPQNTIYGDKQLAANLRFIAKVGSVLKQSNKHTKPFYDRMLKLHKDQYTDTFKDKSKRINSYLIEKLEKYDGFKKTQYGWQVQLNGKFGLTDENIQQIFPPQYDEIRFISTGILMRKNNTSYLYQEKISKPKLIFSQDNITNVRTVCGNNSCFIVVKNKKNQQSVRDKKGNMIIDFKDGDVTQCRFGYFVYKHQDESYSLYTSQGEEVLKDVEYPNVNKDVIIIGTNKYTSKQNGYKITKLPYRITRIFNVNNNLFFCVDKRGVFSLFNNKQQQIIKDFNSIGQYYGYFVVCFADDYGLYNVNGQQMLPPKYRNIELQNKDYAIVSNVIYEGLYDLKNNKFLINPNKYQHIYFGNESNVVFLQDAKTKEKTRIKIKQILFYRITKSLEIKF